MTEENKDLISKLEVAYKKAGESAMAHFDADLLVVSKIKPALQPLALEYLRKVISGEDEDEHAVNMLLIFTHHLE